VTASQPDISAAPGGLSETLARRIRLAGPISVAEYMAEALGHPTLGYYTARDPLGAAGDFITAPEISQTFGELIGLWCAETWERMGRPDPVLLVELGPGRGTLMADALRALRRVAPAFRAALRLHLVETSPTLQRLQAERLADASPAWHDRLADVPLGVPALVVANEFLDALPIRQFVRTGQGWRERQIGLDLAGGGRFAFALTPGPTASLALIPAPLRDAAPAGSLFEACPAALGIAGALGARAVRDGGAALLIDYGHAASACGETLQAVRGHRRHDPLDAPGSADLTAHVDFAAVAHAAAETGARIWGPVPQGEFLRALGIEARAAMLLRRATPAQAAAIESGCRRLIDPAEMGTLFKALAIADPALPPPLAGFPAAPLPLPQSIPTTDGPS
jgi:NADH dehydrogenase [ubiquinone] 1 alpha subcomplex assembly factor 7